MAQNTKTWMWIILILAGALFLGGMYTQKQYPIFSISDNLNSLDNPSFETNDSWGFRWYGVERQLGQSPERVDLVTNWKTEGLRSLRLSSNQKYTAAQAYQSVNLDNIQSMSIDYYSPQKTYITAIISDNPCSGSSFDLACSGTEKCTLSLDFVNLRATYGGGGLSGVKFICFNLWSEDGSLKEAYLDNLKINEQTPACTTFTQLQTYANQWISGTITFSQLITYANSWSSCS